MKIKVKNISDNNDEVTLFLDENFTFTCHQELRDAYESRTTDFNYILDLRDTLYMDSSALGMLLLFRDYVGQSGFVKIVNCKKEHVYNTFMVAKFENFFEISR